MPLRDITVNMYMYSLPVFLLPKLLLHESLHYLNEISFNLMAAFQSNPNFDADLALSKNIPNFKKQWKNVEAELNHWLSSRKKTLTFC